MSLLTDLLGQVDNTFSALIGNQTITGTAGNDLINCLLGHNVLNGGAGNDIVSYATQPQAILANLAVGTVSDFGLTVTDTLTSIENVIGSNFGDTLIANFGSFLEGGLGDDTLISLNGGNTLDGGAGTDTASFLGQADGVAASLATGQAIGNRLDLLVNIENLAGSDFADTLTGGLTDNVLSGGLGDDILSPGGGGADTLIGGFGFDIVDLSEQLGPASVNLALGTASSPGEVLTLIGVEGVYGTNTNDLIIGDNSANSLDGGGGDDTLNGGLFFDTLSGGLGEDTAAYDDAGSAVAVDLQTGQATGGAGADTLNSIEDIIGSNFNDTLNGDGGSNRLQGGGGADLLNGRDGADTLDGGAGNDTVSYADASGAVTVDLSTGSSTGASGADRLISIENVVGSAFRDLLAGDAKDNLLTGMAGADTLLGGEGDDTLDGGTGIDAASYADAAQGVVVRLGAGISTGAGTDILISIENAVGSAFDDVISGDTSANLLAGGGGDDVLIGLRGDDTLDGGAGSDTAKCKGVGSAVTVDLAAGLITSGASVDTLISIENVGGTKYADTMVGDTQANTLRGFGGADTLIGSLGSDVLDGGSGSDTVSYAGAAGKVVIDLAAGAAKGGESADVLRKIENIVGSSFNDGITGNNKHNNIDGGDGNDQITGGLGQDVLAGGAGSDTFIFTTVKDSAKHGAADLITDLEAADTIDLSRIDADTTMDGNQPFHLVDHFTHQAREMTVAYNTNRDLTLVKLDVDGDGHAESVILITGDATSFAHFVL